MEADTYLSPYVQGLLNLLTTETPASNIIADDTYELDVGELERILPENFELTQDGFNEAVSSLLPLFAEAENKMSLESMLSFESKDAFKWITPGTMFSTYGQLLESSNDVDVILYTLILTSGFERGLGDLVFTLRTASRFSQSTEDNELNLSEVSGDRNENVDVELPESEPEVKVPSLLKDLVACDELQDLIGLPLVRLLQVLLGSPLSLNVRNLAWHGFLLPRELPRVVLPAFSVVIITISSIIQEKKIEVIKRKLCGVTEMKTIKAQLGQFDPNLLKKLMENSAILLEGEKCIINRALEFLEEDEQRIYCVYLGLPLLESLMRKLFVRVNGCSSRLVTAEATELYTTFTEMLSAELPDGSQNFLIALFGREILELLQDLLILPYGPRLRDRISHGEADLSLDQEDDLILDAAEVVLHTVFLVLSKLDSRTRSQTTLKYKSQFHPTPVLLRRIQASANLLKSLVTKSDCPPTITGTCSFCTDIGLPGPADDASLTRLAQMCTEIRPETVHRPKPEVDHVRQLILVREAVHQAVKNSLETISIKTEELAAKKLRSRQRLTYMRMMRAVPILSSALYQTLVYLLWSVQRLQDLPTHLHLKILKRLLTLCENISTHASLAKNKWDVVQSLMYEVQDLLEVAFKIEDHGR